MVDTLSLEIHEAQLAANRAEDGEAAGSADASNAAAVKARVPLIQQRPNKKIPQKVSSVPMDPVLEEQPNEASYRSFEEPEQDALEKTEEPTEQPEQSAVPPDDE
eukprot:3425918-Amphidinium_carterae.4